MMLQIASILLIISIASSTLELNQDDPLLINILKNYKDVKQKELSALKDENQRLNNKLASNDISNPELLKTIKLLQGKVQQLESEFSFINLSIDRYTKEEEKIPFNNFNIYFPIGSIVSTYGELPPFQGKNGIVWEYVPYEAYIQTTQSKNDIFRYYPGSNEPQTFTDYTVLNINQIPSHSHTQGSFREFGDIYADNSRGNVRNDFTHSAGKKIFTSVSGNNEGHRHLLDIKTLGVKLWKRKS